MLLPDKAKQFFLNIAYVCHPRRIRWEVLRRSTPNRHLVVPFDRDQLIQIRPCDVVGGEIYVYGLHERKEAQLICRSLRPGMIFFDVGANFGQYTLLAAKRVGNSGSVHSFEPNPVLFRELSRNVRLNGHENVILNQVALLDKPGLGRLARLAPGEEAYGALSASFGSGKRVLGRYEVAVTTLDAYLDSRKLRRVDFIKMDVEGAELLVLKGAQSLLTRSDAPTIVFEQYPYLSAGFDYSHDELFDYLKGFGYTLSAIDKGNFIATKKAGHHRHSK